MARWIEALAAWHKPEQQAEWLIPLVQRAAVPQQAPDKANAPAKSGKPGRRQRAQGDFV